MSSTFKNCTRDRLNEVQKPKMKVPDAGQYDPNKEILMKNIIKDTRFDKEHLTAIQAKMRKFQISKQKVNICSHVERAISEGFVNKKFATSKN